MAPSSKPSNRVFGRRLREARQRCGLPQDVLGVKAGLDESASSARMSRYESGIHEPPFQFAEALSKVLDVSPAYFYCPDDRLAEIIQLYSSMSESDRAELFNVVKRHGKQSDVMHPSEPPND